MQSAYREISRQARFSKNERLGPEFRLPDRAARNYPPAMPQTYRATLEGDHLRWHDAAHPDSREKPVEVQVMVLDHAADEPLISCTPEVSGGNACFDGHRIPVWLVVEAWQIGWSDDEVLAAHPVLRPEHLAAARTYYGEHRREIDRLVAERA